MSLELFDLSGKTALVTGATHGLGMAMAVGLAKAGASLVVNDISADKIENEPASVMVFASRARVAGSQAT